MSGKRSVRSQVQLERGAGWYVAEGDGRRQWRWSSGTGRLQLINRAAEPMIVRLRGEIAAVKMGQVTIRAGDQAVWVGIVEGKRIAWHATEFVVPVGGTTSVEFQADQPGERFFNGDERVLAFAVYDMDVAVVWAKKN